MDAREVIAEDYKVSVSQAADGYHVSYARKPRRRNGAEVGTFEAVVTAGDADSVRWLTPPADRDVTAEVFERDALTRVRLLHVWLGELEELIRSVEGWAKELDWPTRRIDKTIDDSQIGKHKVPALLLQDGADRMILDPLSRQTGEYEASVDLYHMPAYDDIARLQGRDGRWEVFERYSEVADPFSRPGKPLSRDVLREALEGMRRHVEQA